jgi:hypothetical protein
VVDIQALADQMEIFLRPRADQVVEQPQWPVEHPQVPQAQQDRAIEVVMLFPVQVPAKVVDILEQVVEVQEPTVVLPVACPPVHIQVQVV